MDLTLKRLIVKNIQSIKEVEVIFEKTNLITGYNFDTEDGNGCGKTTIIYGILLALFGDKLIDKKLSSLVNKDSESCSADLTLVAKGHELRVVRSVPTKLEVYVDGEKQDITGISEKQKKICDFVGDIETFKKFRIMDKSKGVNILDFSSRQLKKTLMGFSEDRFESLRQRLLKIKTEREKYNRDQVLYKHFPSEKRKTVLDKAKSNIADESSIIEADSEEFNNKYGNCKRQQGKYDAIKSTLSTQISNLLNLGKCPKCFQDVPQEHKERIRKEKQTELDEAVKLLEECRKETNVVVAELNKFRTKKSNLDKTINSINRLIMKLDTRFKQSEYKYTEKDILLIKKAIEAIDHFATYYIIEWVKVVEPIVNSHISKLNMTMKFIVDEKQNISVVIKRNEKDYLYEELSTGEKLFVSFAFNIALLIEQQETGFLICDEGLDVLSPQNVERIFSIIEDTSKQLICVSQHRDLRMENINVISVEKRNDLSEVK